MIPKLKNITYICPPLSCFMNEPLTILLISPLFTFPHTPPLGFRCGSFLIPRLLLLLILYLIPLSLTVSPHSLCVYPPSPPPPLPFLIAVSFSSLWVCWPSSLVFSPCSCRRLWGSLSPPHWRRLRPWAPSPPRMQPRLAAPPLRRAWSSNSPTPRPEHRDGRRERE